MIQLNLAQQAEQQLPTMRFESTRRDVKDHDAAPTTELSPTSPTEHVDQSTSSADANSAEAIKVQNNIKARKRTKTGCLTCRKRRIKCGEERPTCANCIKSKRSCEGYAPRLTFKDPLGAFRPGWALKGHGAHYQSFSSPNGVAGQYVRAQLTPGAPNSFPVIAPRPLPLESVDVKYSQHHGASSSGSAGSHVSPQHGPPLPFQPSNDLPPRMRQMYQNQHTVSNSTSQQSLAQENVPVPASASSSTTSDYYSTTPTTEPVIVNDPSSTSAWTPAVTSVGLSYELLHASSGFADQAATSAFPKNNNDNDNKFATGYDSEVGGYPQKPNSFAHLEHVGVFPHIPNLGEAPALKEEPYMTPTRQGFTDSSSYTWNPRNGVGRQSDGNYVIQDLPPYSAQFQPEALEGQNAFESLKYPSMQLTNHIYDPDEDLYDVESEDEGVAIISRIASTPQNDVGLMLALAASQDDRVLRSYTTFLNEPNVLQNYQPLYTASPLMDSTTARVFCHFITATGPGISIYERHPTNPSVMFTGAPVPVSQQALWTYTLPMRALSNQALLHAMLALASLHIANLQKTSHAPSLRHYHFALKRLTKALEIPSKRTDVGTIAATLILGHYEAVTAEHSKWNQHLAGARQLFMEVDFKGITRQIKEDRKSREAHNGSEIWHSSHHTSPTHYSPIYSSHITPDNAIDENLVSRLMGWKVKYDEYGRIVDDFPERPRASLTEKEIETYKTQSDLFWWFAKQDVYQSVISGNRLLLPYDRWGHCPPRGPIGKLEAIYGTMDHMILLMGRIADFSSKDQLRKRKVMAANGGQWKPPPGMFPSPTSAGPSPGFPPGGPPQHNKPAQMQSSPGGMPPPPPPHPPLQPPMYGMIPPVPPPQTPDRYIHAPRDQIYVPPATDEDFELEEATMAAGKEWQAIQDALSVFERSLGPEWESLPEYLATPFQTAFGTALQFRTWSISCVWNLYYTGRIIAARSHPSMPPAAMMAAGIAARQTAHWANEIGRISCGLQFPPADQPLNPALGAALMESSLGIFFAGVQYTDPIQRSAIVTRLMKIAEMTGSQSSALIGAGCELCWTKMGEAGRGPPYQATVDKTAKDDRLAGRPAPKGDALNRQMIYVHPGTRVHYAMGIMSMEDDFKDMRISKRS